MGLKKTLRFGLAMATVLMFAQSAQAGAIYYFNQITNTTNTTVENQLWVEVDSVIGNPNQVVFTFHNDGPIASSITDIYFDDGSLLGIASVQNGPSGVDFSQLATPSDLSGGNDIDFNTSAGFSADSNPPTQPNGVNPGETVAITFNLISGQTYADTLAALALAQTDPTNDLNGGLRIGIHVQAIAPTGGSDAFVNTPRVPDGGTTMSLLGLGLTGLGLLSRRRKS